MDDLISHVLGPLGALALSVAANVWQARRAVVREQADERRVGEFVAVIRDVTGALGQLREVVDDLARRTG